MSQNAKYCIREGYKANPVLTAREDPTKYWTPERINQSAEFQYHVYQFAQRVYVSKRLQSVLDIGSGPGTKLESFFSDLCKDVAAIDQPGLGTVLKKVFPGVRYHEGNLEKDDLFIGDKFDLVICADVIEHLDNPDGLINIIRAHISDSGCAVISTPDRDMRRGLNNNRSPNPEHVREWNFHEFREYLDRSGLSVERHFNLPLKKLPPVLYWFSQSCLYRKIKRQDWFACQVALVR